MKFLVVCGSEEFIALFTRVLHTKQVVWSSNAPGIDFEGYPFQIWPYTGSPDTLECWATASN
jgi:hypothetical protein